MARLVLWRGTEEWLAEAAAVELTDGGVRATGTQLGADPAPYRLDYQLDAADGFVTGSLRAQASGDGWARQIELSHDGEGGWRYDAEREGEVDFADPGGDTDALRGALDCDLEFSPLTNLMPVRRRSIHRKQVEFDFLIAWVSVPELGLHASRQRYEHVRREQAGSVVRFVSLDGDFRSELELDPDGLVVHYPRLARRVAAGSRA
jgi:uncharacterized protein